MDSNTLEQPNEAFRHLSVIVLRHRWQNWFRKSYWVRCWKCNLADGPYFDLAEARVKERWYYGFMQSQRPQCRARQERALL